MVHQRFHHNVFVLDVRNVNVEKRLFIILVNRLQVHVFYMASNGLANNNNMGMLNKQIYYPMMSEPSYSKLSNTQKNILLHLVNLTLKNTIAIACLKGQQFVCMIIVIL